MLGYLAVITFCLGGECAFYVAKTISETEAKCERVLPRMMAELEKEIGSKPAAVPGCIKVPVQLI